MIKTALKKFVESNLNGIRQNIIKKPYESKDKDGNITKSGFTLRLPDLILGTPQGRVQKYETVHEFKGNDGTDYCVQMFTNARLITKAEAENGSSNNTELEKLTV